MVIEHIKRKFALLDNDSLMYEYAFRQYQYTPKALDIIEKLIDERGLDKNAVRVFRLKRLKKLQIKTFRIECDKCSERLILDMEELLSGEFECPVCYKRQLVNYKSLIIEKPEQSSSLKDSFIGSKLIADDRVEGLDGWLAVLGFLLAVQVIAYSYYLYLSIRFGYLNMALGNLIGLQLAAYVNWLYWSKKRAFKPAVIILLSIAAIDSMITINYMLAYGSWYVITKFINLGLALIWIIYILKSKRAQNTFIYAGALPFVDRRENPEEYGAIHCSNCDKAVSPSSNFCPHCGMRIFLPFDKKNDQGLGE